MTAPTPDEAAALKTAAEIIAAQTDPMDIRYQGEDGLLWRDWAIPSGNCYDLIADFAEGVQTDEGKREQLVIAAREMIRVAVEGSPEVAALRADLAQAREDVERLRCRTHEIQAEEMQKRAALDSEVDQWRARWKEAKRWTEEAGLTADWSSERPLPHYWGMSSLAARTALFRLVAERADALADLAQARARVQAVRPVLDAAEAWVDWRERTGQPEGLEHYLWAIRDAVAAYRAAASGSAEAPMSVNEHGAGEHVNDHADHGNAHGSAEADEPAPAWVRDETRTEWAVRTTGTGGVEMIGGVTTELHARAWAQQAVGDHPGEIAAAVPVSRTIVHRVSAWTSDAERAAAVPAVASGDDTQPDGRGVAAQAVLSRWAVLSDDDAHSTMSLADAYKIVDVVSRALAEAGAPAQPDERPAMKPANYWRATFGPHACDPTNRSAVWCESSDEAEVRASLRNAPGGGLVFRLFERPRETDWRPAPLAGAADTAREPTDA
ncbi:hypothetical protein TOK_0441 [Pseudonocardia sp. N23]|nr:hypothetical protein TOK_0441 [Pseudonocardia sp. N23]